MFLFFSVGNQKSKFLTNWSKFEEIPRSFEKFKSNINMKIIIKYKWKLEINQQNYWFVFET